MSQNDNATDTTDKKSSKTASYQISMNINTMVVNNHLICIRGLELNTSKLIKGERNEGQHNIQKCCFSCLLKSMMTMITITATTTFHFYFRRRRRHLFSVRYENKHNRNMRTKAASIRIIMVNNNKTKKMKEN